MTDKSSETPEHWTALGYLRPIFDYLVAQKEPLKPYLDIVGIREADLSNPDLRIANETLTPLFALAERRCSDPNIGLHMAQGLRVQHVGIIGMLILTCERASEAFDLQVRYMNLIGNAVHARYAEKNGELCLEIWPQEGNPPLSRHVHEYNLAGWLRVARFVVGRQFKLYRVDLPYDRPLNDQEQQSEFDAPIRYRSDKVRLYAPLIYRDLVLQSCDRKLRTLLEQQALQQLRQLEAERTNRDPWLEAIREAIAAQLPYHLPVLEDIAAALNTSERTLQRQLEQRGNSFTELLDEVRITLAVQYLKDEKMSFSDIALMLGFSAQSSFTRAFSRWFGEPPGKYRARLVGGS